MATAASTARTARRELTRIRPVATAATTAEWLLGKEKSLIVGQRSRRKSVG
jgi:hypothetical protein